MDLSVMSSPLKRIWPLVGSSMPMMSLASVDLAAAVGSGDDREAVVGNGQGEIVDDALGAPVVGRHLEHRCLSSSMGYSVSVSSRLDSSGLIIAKIPPSRRNHNDTILVGNGDARTGRILTNTPLLRAGRQGRSRGPSQEPFERKTDHDRFGTGGRLPRLYRREKRADK